MHKESKNDRKSNSKFVLTIAEIGVNDSLCYHC
jgi:hypothetical protein